MNILAVGEGYIKQEEGYLIVEVSSGEFVILINVLPLKKLLREILSTDCSGQMVLLDGVVLTVEVTEDTVTITSSGSRLTGFNIFSTKEFFTAFYPDLYRYFKRYFSKKKE